MTKSHRKAGIKAADHGAPLAGRFKRFAERECSGVSPLYSVLARAVAKDANLLTLAACAPPEQPPPNMLFAAVRMVLFAEPEEEPLRRFYPDLTAEPAPRRQAAAAFRDFCRRHQAALGDILRRRVVSTNEAARAACLLPAFALAAEAGGGPLHLVEIGASAGLLLLWDRYGYDYGPAGSLGPAAAAVRLRCAVRGRRRPAVPGSLPAVATRVGIDKHPLNAFDEADMRWLRALVWPEQTDRIARLGRAMEHLRADPPILVAGDALTIVPQIMERAPAQGTLCLYHSFTLNQFPAPARRAFEELLRGAARRRPFHRVSLEWGDDAPAPELRLFAYGGDAVDERRLAYCDAHGAWMEWLGE